MASTNEPRASGSSWRRRLAVAAVLLVAAGCSTLRGARGPASAKPAPVWVSYPEASVAKVENPHNYLGGQLCQKCHTGPGGALRAGRFSCSLRCS